jgi:hypothetical protein
VSTGRPYRQPEPPPRSYRRIILTLLGVVLVVSPFVVDQLGVRRVSGIDFPATDPMSADLRKRVEQLASPSWAGRKPGTEANAHAALYLADAMRDTGLEPLPSLGGYLAPLVDVITKVPTRLGHNVVGYLPATEPPADAGRPPPWIVLGAHFDHIGPTSQGVLLGADDNASGVAVLLSAVAGLKAQAIRRHPVAIVFFNTEEPPYFGTPNMGSFTFVQNAPMEMGQPPHLRLAVILDLIGGVVWRSGAETIFACGAEKSIGLGAVVDSVREDGLDVRRLGIHMVENQPGRAPSAVSDYDAFRDRGTPFLFVSSGRTPNYHRATDLPATLHYDRMARTARWLGKLVAAVDAAPGKWTVDPQAQELGKDVETLLAMLAPATTLEKTIPGTSPAAFLQLKADQSRLQRMADPAHGFNKSDELMIERAGFRLQCLLWSLPVCFTL